MIIKTSFFHFFAVLHISSLSVICCWDATFTTICNASHFNSLENLIGSIHTYAPSNFTILVADAGLTAAQRRLLSLYRNVRVSPVSKLSTKGRRVAVTDELVDYENERFISRVNNKQHGLYKAWPYIDSIRKQPKLAVVIPFIRSQLSPLANQFNLSTVFRPCRSLAAVDLVFYHNEGWLSSLEWLVLRMLKPYDRIVRRCFARVRVLAANLAGPNDSYFLGSGIMWRKLIDDRDEVSLSSFGYTHFFIMEADALPIRSYWLDGIREQIIEGRSEQHVSTAWWMSGSIYRGSHNIGVDYAHINGNGLYHLSSNFIAFVRFFWQFFLQSGPLGYDYAISYVLGHSIRHAAVWKSVSHRFRYSEFIQNCWHTGCELNGTKFALDNPQTYLVHGGLHAVKTLLLESNAENESKNFFRPNSFLSYILMVLVMSGCVFLILSSLLMVLNRREKYQIIFHRWHLFHLFSPGPKLPGVIGVFFR